MKTFFPSALCVLAFVAPAAKIQAQEAKGPSIQVTVKTQPVQTPQFNPPNVPNKAWRPHNWMEVDVDLVPRASGTVKGFTLESIQVSIYVSLNVMDPTSRKYVAFSGSMNALNVPAHGVEHSHILAYISPSTLSRALNKPDFVTGDIKAVGVEVSYQGKVLGGYSSTGGKWWEESDKVNLTEGLLPKYKTPFSILWGDYDLEIKS